MKSIILGLSVLFISSQAFAAGEYRCSGKETVPNPDSIDTVLVVTEKSVKFEGISGSEHTLARAPMKNEEKNTYATYADYEYDGYGGFIELRVPKKIRPGSFPAYYQQDVYSELGKVAEIRIKLTCSAK